MARRHEPRRGGLWRLPAALLPRPPACPIPTATSISLRPNTATPAGRSSPMANAVPRGGGQYLVGRPYTVAGRRYYPAENPSYTAVGMASWYGAAFHGRRTANGEVYDMASLSAAHPTMPLPSYARVTNLEQRLFGHRAGQRSRPLSCRAGDGRILAGRRRPRHEGDGHRQGEGRLCRTRADRGIGQFAIAGEPSHRRIASQYDRLFRRRS